MSKEDLLEWRGFVINDRPACMWGFDLPDQNHEFLSSIDPAYFNQAVAAQLPLLETENRQNAALAIRTTYAHALETLFALLCAAVQAPHCPLGWILKYRPGDVPKVVRKIQEGAELLTRLRFNDGWQGISERIHLFVLEDPEEERRIKRLFGDLWLRLAWDFLDDWGSIEYNSIKHGLRSKASGFALRIARTDEPAAPVVDSTSEYGSRFFAMKPIREDSVNFSVQRVSRAWAPRALAIRTELIGASLTNVTSFLKVHSGAAMDSVNFEWPDPDNDITGAWVSPGSISSFAAGETIDLANTNLKRKQDILAFYDGGPDL